jgi:hypothetical protein
MLQLNVAPSLAASAQVRPIGHVQPGRPVGNYRGISAFFARLRAVSACALLTAVLPLGAAPSLSAQVRGPFWAFQYVQFATPSNGWALAEKDTEGGFTDLLTSDDGGRRWHDVTPPVVLAGEKAEIDNPDATSPLLTPFVLNSRDAWVPVESSYGKSSELEVFMTSDSGRRWALRGRFPGPGLLGSIFFLNPSTGFIDTEVGQDTSEDRAPIYATSDGGKHWREVSVINDSCGNVGGLSFASPRVGSSVGTAAPGGRASYARATGVVGGVTSPSRRPITAITGASSPRCSRPHGSAARSWR